MPASYPGAVKVFATRSAGQTIDASHTNDLQDEVNAIEAGLINGTAPLTSSRASVQGLQVTGNSTLGSTITIGTNTYVFSTAAPASTGHVLTAQTISGSTVTVGWQAASAGLGIYASTVTSLANSSVETEILNVTIPANSWSDGDWIDVRYQTLAKSNPGSTSSIVLSVNVGAGSSVTLGTILTVDDATEYNWPITFRMVRQGANVYVSPPATPMNTVSIGGTLWPNLGAQGVTGGASAPANFTSAQTVQLKAKMANASANMYINRVTATAGTAMHFKR